MLEARAIADELMDDVDLPPDEYARVLRDLSRVNAVTLARRPTLAFLQRALGARRAFTLLDVGFGNGDMLRAIAIWAGRRGIYARLTGVDLNPNSAPAARASTPGEMTIAWKTGHYAEIGRFDFIVSSLVAHHMTRAQLIAFLRHMEANAARGWFVNDLHRVKFAYMGFPLLAALLRVHPIVRHDGRLSIARSYRREEWRALLDEAGVTDARVFRSFPARLCVERLR